MLQVYNWDFLKERKMQQNIFTNWKIKISIVKEKLKKIRFNMYMLRPEHRQREPNQTNETKIFSCPILHIYEWISWISSSFKGELRVHLCRGVFTCQWLSNVLFKEQGSIKVWSCLWKWIMWRTKEITEDLGNRVDVATVTFPRRGRPTKITPKQNV